MEGEVGWPDPMARYYYRCQCSSPTRQPAVCNTLVAFAGEDVVTANYVGFYEGMRAETVDAKNNNGLTLHLPGSFLVGDNLAFSRAIPSF